MADAHFSDLSNNSSGHSFEEMISSVEDYAIFTLSPQGYIQSWNRGAEEINQYTAEEVIGQHFSVFYCEMDLLKKLPEEELRIASREGRFADEGWRFRKDGTRFWASVVITAFRSTTDEVEGYLKIVRDLTERRMAAEQLRQSEEGFRLLLENVYEYAIFMLDPEGHVITWNAGAKRIKGYVTAEALGLHFSIFYPAEAKKEDLPSKLLARALREGQVEDEGWRVRKDGTRFWALVLLTAVYDQQGELRGYTKITRDLSDRRKIDDLEDLDRKKDAFLATLAHELRSPLSPLLTGLDILRRSGKDEATVQMLSETLVVQVQQISRLVEDLLDMSRIRLGKIKLKKESVLLSGLLNDIGTTIQPMVLEHGHRFVISHAHQDVQVMVDQVRIVQILTNLLANGCKFTPVGGEIRLEATVTNHKDLTLSVTDNGKGIEKEWQARIFNLYDQVADGQGNGLGIGLALVKDLVELHGGSVKVESEGIDRGTNFTIELPNVVRWLPSGGLPLSAIAKDSGDKKEIGKFRVLVADDGKNAADVLGLFFRLEGMDTRVAYDGEQAVLAAREFLPDLILMDLGMPKLSGLDAARILRLEMPEVPLVALSGWGTDEDRKRTAEVGFIEHLVKPASPAELRTMMHRIGIGSPP